MRPVQRILVALDASPHSRAALYEAAQLAERLQAELEGIFVLDTELLRLGELPIARETGMTSATRRAIDLRAMERALERQAAQAQAVLELAAQQHRIRSTFRLLRGNVAAEVLAAAANADLLALGRQGQSAVSGRRLGSTVRRIAAQAGCSVLVLAQVPRAGQCVIAVYDGSEQARASLAYALHQARHREENLTVMLSGAIDSLSDLRTEASQALTEEAGDAPPNVTFDSIRPGASGALSEAVKRHNCGLLVIPHTSALLPDYEELLRSVGCPVLLTR